MDAGRMIPWRRRRRRRREVVVVVVGEGALTTYRFTLRIFDGKMIKLKEEEDTEFCMMGVEKKSRNLFGKWYCLIIK